MIRQHLDAATNNLSIFHKLGFSEIDLPNNPALQCDALRATVEELNKAIERLQTTRWPSPKDLDKI